MRVKIIVDTSKCVADALVEAESIIIDKVDDGLYRVVITTPSGAVYLSNPTDADIVGDLPSGEKTIDQWYNRLTFRKRKNNESPVTKTTFFE